MNQEQIKHLHLVDGDLLSLPAGTSPEVMRELSSAIAALHPGKRILLFAGAMESIPESAMRQAGWTRQQQPTLH